MVILYCEHDYTYVWRTATPWLHDIYDIPIYRLVVKLARQEDLWTYVAENKHYQRYIRCL